MDAVPLKHGRKIVAWACGRCGTPGSFGAQGVRGVLRRMSRSEAPPMLEALRALTARHDCGIALLAAVQNAEHADKETERR